MASQSSSTAEIRRAIYPARTSRESAANDPNPIQLTALAIKYGERGSIGDSRSLAAGKSGLTPTELFNSAEAFPKSEKEWKDYMQVSGYQRGYMRGYTTSELRDFLAIEYKDAKPSNLVEIPYRVGESVIDASLLPVVQKSNWKICIADSFVDGGYSNNFYESVSDMPPNHLASRRRILGTTDGYMDVGCEAVWQAIQPALRLVGRVLLNAHGSHIYYDTLFHGTRVYVDPQRVPPDWNGARLRQMLPSEQPPTGLSILDDWIEMSSFLTLFIIPQVEGTPMEAGCDGYTSVSQTSKNVFIGIGASPITALLSDKLTDSERNVNTMHLAATILHELAHAVLFWVERCNYERLGILHEPLGNDIVEPYYRDNWVSEAGWTGENEIWGGELQVDGPLPAFRDLPEVNDLQIIDVTHPPKMFIGKSHHPSREVWARGTYNTPALDNIWTGPGRWASPQLIIRQDFLQDLYEPEFWDTIVAKYGIEILKDNTAPFYYELSRDYDGKEKVPNSFRIMSHRDADALAKVHEFAAEPKRPDDAGWLFRRQRMFNLNNMARQFRNQRMNEARGSKRWGGPDDKFTLTNAWGIPVQFDISLEQALNQVADELKITVDQLRKRGRQYVEEMVHRLFEKMGVPRGEFFNFEKENVLLPENGDVVVPDLDEIVTRLLQEEEAKGNPMKADIEAARGNPENPDLEHLVNLIKLWLLNNDYFADYFDEEMLRRSRIPSTLFYRKPDANQVYLETELFLASKGTTNQSSFSMAEYVRDTLQSMGYPREALDEELGRFNVANRITGQVLDSTKQDFYSAIQLQYGIGRDQIADDGIIERVIELWRVFLVNNRISTTIFL